MSLGNLSHYSNYASIFLRLSIGFIFVYHGLPKLYKSKMMAQGMGFPSAAVIIIGLAEVLGGLGVAFGFHIRTAAAILALIMIGATYMKIVKWHVPFTAMDKTGWEYDLILFAANVAIVFSALK